jgi:hypothetical protein
MGDWKDVIDQCAAVARERKASILLSEAERQLCYEHAERIALSIEALKALPAPPGDVEKGIPIYASRDATDDVLGKDS